MYSEVISNRDFGYSFYIKCDCGKELLHFVYFPESTDYPELIFIKYYGPDSGSQSDIFNLDMLQLRKLSDYLKLSLSENVCEFKLDDSSGSLFISKDELGFYTLKRVDTKLMRYLHDETCWEISLRDFSIEALVSELDLMYKTIDEFRIKAKVEALARLEEQKQLALNHKKKRLTKRMFN